MSSVLTDPGLTRFHSSLRTARAEQAYARYRGSRVPPAVHIRVSQWASNALPQAMGRRTTHAPRARFHILLDRVDHRRPGTELNDRPGIWFGRPRGDTPEVYLGSYGCRQLIFFERVSLFLPLLCIQAGQLGLSGELPSHASVGTALPLDRTMQCSIAQRQWFRHWIQTPHQTGLHVEKCPAVELPQNPESR